jgi:hypothetical protein
MNRLGLIGALCLALSACQSQVDKEFAQLSWLEAYLPEASTSVLTVSNIEDAAQRKLALRLLDSLSSFKKDSVAEQCWGFYKRFPGHPRANQMGELAVVLAESRGQFERSGQWSLDYVQSQGYPTNRDQWYMRAAASFEQVGDYSHQLQCLDSAAASSLDSNIVKSAKTVGDLIRAGALSPAEQLERILHARGQSLDDLQ